ncbi:hypothetical protein SAMN05444320_105568 [Streptoalloteichus hindustanus]|uniref:Uncharacterized protein n=1 Tax=Streptoalloteichus hindustanus TaxID=2017 RepID=A0A1M5FT12_STRHI|nr:hypothetical protein SAMN05444320_105568 [Streptoalloteichus hindustanus]
MTYSIEVYHYSHAGHPEKPVIARTPVEPDRILDEILAADQPHPPVMYVRERPKFGPDHQPDHQLKIDAVLPLDLVTVHIGLFRTWRGLAGGWSAARTRRVGSSGRRLRCRRCSGPGR